MAQCFNNHPVVALVALYYQIIQIGEILGPYLMMNLQFF